MKFCPILLISEFRKLNLFCGAVDDLCLFIVILATFKHNLSTQSVGYVF